MSPWMKGFDDEWDGGEDEGLGAVGVAVAVEAGVEGKAAGLAGRRELLAVLGGDQSQKVLGLVAAGANVDGQSGDWEAGKWDSVLDHLEVNLGSDGQGLEDLSAEVDGHRGALLGHDGVGVDGQLPRVHIAVVLKAWASLEVGLGHCHGHQGKNQGEGFHLDLLLRYISIRQARKTRVQSVPM